MIFGFFLWRRDPNAFQADRYGPTERRRRQLESERRWRLARWIKKLPPLERATVTLLLVTAGVLIVLAGFVLGLALVFTARAVF